MPGSARPTRTRTGAPPRSCDDSEVVRALGADHPLARTQRAIGIAMRQRLAAAAVLAATPILVLVSLPLAIAMATAAALVFAGLCGILAGLTACRRRQVRDLLLEGRAPPLEPIRSEIERLVDPARTARTAQVLVRALHEGEHWHEYLPASRPPPGVRHLTQSRTLVAAIVSDLHAGHVSPRAAILLDRLIEGGYGASIYQGGPESVRRELGRIRFELQRDAAERPAPVAR